MVIGINPKARDARFLFFHRGGLTSSRLLKLEEDDDRKLFSGALMAMLQWATPEEAGYFEYRPDRRRMWDSAAITSSRTCIRGRANLVAILRRQSVLRVLQGPEEGDIRQLATSVRAACRSPRLVEAERQPGTKAEVYSSTHIVSSPLSSAFVSPAC